MFFQPWRLLCIPAWESLSEMFGACETPAVTLSSIQQRRPLLYQSHLARWHSRAAAAMSFSPTHGISERRDVSEMKKSPSECERWSRPDWLLTLPSTALERFLYINSPFFKEKLVPGRRSIRELKIYTSQSCVFECAHTRSDGSRENAVLCIKSSPIFMRS